MRAFISTRRKQGNYEQGPDRPDGREWTKFMLTLVDSSTDIASVVITMLRLSFRYASFVDGLRIMSAFLRLRAVLAAPYQRLGPS